MIGVRHQEGTIEITFEDGKMEYIQNISQVDIVCDRIMTYRIFSNKMQFEYLVALADLFRSAKREMAAYLEKHNLTEFTDAKNAYR